MNALSIILKIVASTVIFAFHALSADTERSENLQGDSLAFVSDEATPAKTEQRSINRTHSRKKLQTIANEIKSKLDNCMPHHVERGSHPFSIVKKYGIDPYQLTWDYYFDEYKNLTNNCNNLITSSDPLSSDFSALSSTFESKIPKAYDAADPHCTRTLYDAVYAAALCVEDYTKVRRKKVYQKDAQVEYSGEVLLNTSALASDDLEFENLESEEIIAETLNTEMPTIVESFDPAS